MAPPPDVFATAGVRLWACQDIQGCALRQLCTFQQREQRTWFVVTLLVVGTALVAAAQYRGQGALAGGARSAEASNMMVRDKGWMPLSSLCALSGGGGGGGGASNLSPKPEPKPPVSRALSTARQ